MESPIITNETLREGLVPIDRHRARLNAIQLSPHLSTIPDFMENINEHTESLRTIQDAPDKINDELLRQMERGSNWRKKEISILLANGFPLFVGDDFLLKCKYAAGFRFGTELVKSCKGDRWDKPIIYNGDMPDSVIEKVVKIDKLSRHTHYRTYTGSLGTKELFADLEYLVVSTSPLPISSSFVKVDPFLLTFRRENGSYPMIDVSESGRIKEIRQTVGIYGFLIVGMWDMDEEVFAESI